MSGLPWSSVKGFLIKLGRKLRRFAHSGDLYVFLLFLMLAFVFWMSRRMSGTYQTEVLIPVTLTEETGQVRVTRGFGPPLRVSVSGKGSAIWKEQHLRRRGNLLKLGLEGFQMSDGHGAMATVLLRDSVARMLPQALTIRDITPDSLTFSYILEKKVMLPVESGGILTSLNQYVPYTVTFSPDSVLVGIDQGRDCTGLTVKTEPFSLEVGTDTIRREVTLVPQPGMVLEETKVQMTVTARQYTEKELEVPVSCINAPAGVDVRLFPSKVKLLFWVSIDEFDTVSAKDFLIVVDYASLSEGERDKAEPYLLAKPAAVDRVRIQPAQVDYLIENGSAQ